MNFKPIFFVNGIMLLILSLAMMIPMMVDLADRSTDWQVFAASQIITAFSGFLMIFINRERVIKITLRETFLMTCLSWVLMALYSAIPFCLAEIKLDFAHAFFEAMSGITTTGSTVISGLDTLPRGILLWRSLLHWIGGIGFLVVALAILPLLQISGMQIFKTQSFDIEKILPSASQMAWFLLGVYSVITVVCIFCLNNAGMTFFDAVNHAMSVVATGGFSTHDKSIGYFNNAQIEFVVIFFMIVASLPFMLHFRVLKRDFAAIARDSQVRVFLSICMVAITIMAVYLLLFSPYTFFDSIRHAAFAVLAIITGTGFATQDYAAWGMLPVGLVFCLSMMGGCSGSTTGGMKTFRFQILWSMLKLQVNKLITPSGVFQVHYNKKAVDANVQTAVSLFFFVYLALFFFAGVLLMMNGLSFITAFSGAMTAISNVGPGLGPVIGPSGNFSSLNAASLWILSACMLLGRLEIFTILVLLSPRFWRQ
ncbi:MAG: TrkH family potassium uptake protein [Alphaproteobacteria bacterium]|nr:TrkH family potassium uptake protein [Alphaproteobacteria bacterium]